MRGVLLERYTGRPIVEPRLRDQLRARDLEHVAEFIERSRLMPTIVGAERNPPLYMDVNNAYSGDELGLPNRDFIGEGIVAAGDLAVSAGAGNSVNIAAGSAWVLGDTNPALQPNYRVYNDAVVNLGISPDPTNPRRVLVGAQVTDQGFAGSGRVWALSAIHGTPAASPTLPATPASFLPLANVLVPAAAASSAAYTFTDMRSRAMIGAGQAIVSALAPYRKTTSKQVVNTAVETDLLNGEITIGANAIGASGVLRISLWGNWINNTGAARIPPRFRLKLGGTTMIDTSTLAANWSPAVNRYPWRLRAEIRNLGSPSSQETTFEMWGLIASGVGAAATGFGAGFGVSFIETLSGGLGRYWAQGYAVPAIDTTVARLLEFTTANGLADPSYDVTLTGALVEIV